MEIPLQNLEVILIGKALLIAVFGVFLGFIAKYIVRKTIDKVILKKLIKDASTYDTSALINKIFTEVIQWVIIIIFVNYSLTMLNFNFLANAISFIIERGRSVQTNNGRCTDFQPNLSKSLTEV